MGEHSYAEHMLLDDDSGIRRRAQIMCTTLLTLMST